jgi:hypothetical protein
MDIEKLNKIYEDIQNICLQSFDKKYPSWISNGLFTIELKLKDILIDVQKLEELKKEIKQLTLSSNEIR